MLKPTMISVGILETMWVWNDYLLPTLVLDSTKYMTIPIHPVLPGQLRPGGDGPMMACIMLTMLPVIIFYWCARSTSSRAWRPAPSRADNADERERGGYAVGTVSRVLEQHPDVSDGPGTHLAVVAQNTTIPKTPST